MVMQEAGEPAKGRNNGRLERSGIRSGGESHLEENQNHLLWFSIYDVVFLNKLCCILTSEVQTMNIWFFQHCLVSYEALVDGLLCGLDYEGLAYPI